MRLTTSCALAVLICSWLAVPEASRSAQDNTISVVLPADWVPFRADVLNISERDVSRGKFYRRRDGSTAHYLDTAAGPAITIHNVATRQTYVKLGDGPWASRDIDDRALAGPPPELRLPRKQVDVFQDAVLGDVYEFTNSGGAGVVRLSPRLNGFRISLRGPNGVNREYLNIIIGDQPDELFIPELVQ